MSKYKYALYNGVKLPALPSEQLSDYPFATIVKDYSKSDVGSYLIITNKPTVIGNVYSIYGVYLGNYLRFNDKGQVYLEVADWLKAEDISREDAIGKNFAWSLPFFIDELDGSNPQQYNVIVWSNHNIYYEDGSIYCFGSDYYPLEDEEPTPDPAPEPDPEPEPEPEPEPKKTFCLRSWLTGFTMGLSGKPFHYVKAKEPTAYLYNGIRLPALPEWDRVKYPYAYIVRNINATAEGYEYGLVLRKTATTVLPDNHAFLLDVLHKCIGNVWMEGIVGTGFNWALQGKVVWSNTDVYDKDGTLYLAASEPVPVYE